MCTESQHISIYQFAPLNIPLLSWLNDVLQKKSKICESVRHNTFFPITSPLSPKQPISHHITLLSKCSAWFAKSKPWCHLVTLIIQCFGCQLSLGCCMAYDLRHILQTEPSSEHGNCYSLQGLHSKYWIRACFVSLAMFSNITQQKLIWLSLDQSNLYSGQD